MAYGWNELCDDFGDFSLRRYRTVRFARIVYGIATAVIGLSALVSVFAGFVQTLAVLVSSMSLATKLGYVFFLWIGIAIGIAAAAALLLAVRIWLEGKLLPFSEIPDGALPPGAELSNGDASSESQGPNETAIPLPEGHWQCRCGNANPESAELCPVCGRSARAIV